MAAVPREPWLGLHCFLRATPEDTDAFLVEDLAPLLDGLVAGREAAAWSFARHEEGGAHLRVRVRGPRPAARAELGPALRRLAGARLAQGAEVREVPYAPGPGGPFPVSVAEGLRALATRVAVDCVAGASRGGPRLAVAADLAHATAWALGLDRYGAARWLRGQAARRPWARGVPLLPARLVHAQVNTVYAAQREGLASRAGALLRALADGTAGGPVARWAAAVRAAESTLPSDAREPRAQWAALLHALLNGLGVAPEEELAVYRLAAKALLDSGEPLSYFPDGHLDADRQYLERSKFQIGLDRDSLARHAPPERLAQAPEVSLPGGSLPEVSLRAAVTGRTSTRRLGGPLTAAGLGTLLWGAHAASHTTGSDAAPVRHRPYPSAGSLYTAGLRLFALEVEGLAPGTYQAVPERRSLRRVADAPSLDEVRALSAYLTLPREDPLSIAVDGVPAVLGLFVDLGRLRQRYGLRALRLGLLEAGHLAQSLLLTASALGLATTPLGGFRDDLAQELFGLDDLDQPLQYLLPLGRAV
ncbi:thiopeptide-type bacteriocin biosynthesis protein [Streptomyces sp. NBC_00249]|uniref:thiopeptide-type bacteriocin biosynthesis protein n=1 Tax=Streptomyces sp. NBC_00249 TaxID=2975690 RepID=UPI002258454D|nr:thiopeptide-type bacteriocin biosynthesis protein [Streptomyces sp. NBC_00249]MCX5192606.1 thiopeptide-type bacteriocin biosynthesis protein [Streptomyces sp. NBC_00249]